MRFIIFGAGGLYSLYKRYFSSHKIVAFIDNDKDKQDRVLDGVRVYAPKMIERLIYDRIYILNKRYTDDMRKQLLELGVSGKKIFTVFDLKKLNSELVPCQTHCYYFIKKESNKKRVLVITNGFSLTGAPLAVYYAAVALMKNGYNVYVLSAEDGPLKQQYLLRNITVIIDQELMISCFDDINNIDTFDLVIVATSLYYYLFYRKSINIPVIWWVHEAKEFYSFKISEKKIFKDVSIFAGGCIAKKNFERVFPGNDVNELLYGIPDAYISSIGHDGKMIFAVLGTICKRKGQDVFLEAIAGIPLSIRSSCKFWIIGDASSAFGSCIKKQIGNMISVRFFNEVDHDKLIEIYQKISVLVCPSREDPMPVVITEAMMNCKPVLVAADGIGNAEFIRDGVNGLLFAKENAKELAKKIIWCYKNREKLSDIGKQGRKIYEAYFTLDKFEKNLLSIVQEKLK